MMESGTIQDVWQRYVQTREPALREALILQYGPLVRYVVGRLAIVRPALLDRDDIVSEGSIGLMEAIDRYDPAVGVKFETYAIPRIRGRITDSLRRANPLSRGSLRRVRQVERGVAALQQELGREPTDQEAMRYLELPPAEYYQARADADVLVLPLETPARFGTSAERLQFADLVADDRAPAPDEAVARAELLNALTGAIEQLPERDRLVLALYYQEGLTLREIGQVLQVSESRVSQIHSRLVLRLRTLLDNFRYQPAGPARASALTGSRVCS